MSSTNLSHCFTSALKPTAYKFYNCYLSHCLTCISTSSSSAKRLPPRWFFSRPNRSHKGPSLDCKADVQEVPTAVLEFSPALLGLYGVWHCHGETVPLLPVGQDSLCELDPEAWTELHSKFTFSPCFWKCSNSTWESTKHLFLYNGQGIVGL
jgi:hypothetical protein